MAKIKATKNASKKIKLSSHHGFLEGVVVYYGFKKPTITMSFIHGETGLPITGLTKSNFSVTAIQAPNGWALSKKLKVAPVHNKSDGVYTFTVSDKGKDLKKGPWTIVVRAIKAKGKTVLNGQTVIHFKMP